MGAVRVGVVAVFALFLAAQPISALVATAIKGVAGTKQDEQTKQERWAFSTQTSLPKSEALCLLVPGLFGYRMDTPRDMAAFGSAYEAGVYWGQAGRDLGWDAAYDQWVKNGKQGPAPSGFMMHYTGGGNYTGVLVILIAIWASLQSFRRENSIFSLTQRRCVWFWTAAGVISLLLAFGRYAPFYRLFYALPYASSIRNPSKFTHAVNLALVVLFGFGLQGLCRGYLAVSANSALSLRAHLKNWWSRVSTFDRKWVLGSAIALALSVIGWLIYVSSRQSLEAYIASVAGGAETGTPPKDIASFSIGEVGWFVLFLFFGVTLVALFISGWFAGRRAKLGAVLLGLLLVFDLGRANQPWIIVSDYDQRYQSNHILDILRVRPYEHRVACLPRLLPRILPMFKGSEKIAELENYFQNGIYPPNGRSTSCSITISNLWISFKCGACQKTCWLI